MLVRLCHLIAVAAVASAYSASKPAQTRRNAPPSNPVAKAFAAAASASLAFALVGGPLDADATSKTAGQISLNSIPPSSVNLNVKDLPVIGSAISGTYARVSNKDVASPSISISSPKDKIGAIKAAATSGHLELDVDGILATHVDIDVAADEAGVLTAKVSSPLIPKLPFKNSASSGAGGAVGKGKPSKWFKVTNLGDGNDFWYFNEETGESTYEMPSKI